MRVRAGLTNDVRLLRGIIRGNPAFNQKMRIGRCRISQSSFSFILLYLLSGSAPQRNNRHGASADPGHIPVNRFHLPAVGERHFRVVNPTLISQTESGNRTVPSGT